MTRNTMRVLGVAAVGIALSAAGPPGASAGAVPRLAASSRAAGSAAAHVAVAPGTRLWVRQIPGSNVLPALAVSRDGRRVFVTGTTSDTKSGAYVTAAFSGVTGKRLWLKRYQGPGNREYRASSVAVSPNGRRVFVTGYAPGGGGYATVAYSAASGARLWARQYQPRHPPLLDDIETTGMAVSPGGLRVFVTGYVVGAAGYKYATVAYNAVTGARLWAKQYNRPGNDDRAFSVAVSPDGRRVFVTGGSTGPANPGLSWRYTTVGYNAGTGAQLWARQYSGRDQGAKLEAHAVTVSPDSRRVFVSGSDGASYATVAYNALTGRQLWAAWYGPAHSFEAIASGLAVSPDGRSVFVTGRSDGDYATVAYNAVTGRQLWAARYGATDESGIALSPDGRQVFVTGGNRSAGWHWHYATVAYNAVTGKRLWVTQDNPSGVAFAIVAARHEVFVTGYGTGYVTVAYRS